MIRILLVVVMMLSFAATASADGTRFENGRWVHYKTWYIWQCVNCYYTVETNYNGPPAKYTGPGATMCPYDKIKGHVFSCVGTREIAQN